jgi:hypothetical protein
MPGFTPQIVSASSSESRSGDVIVPDLVKAAVSRVLARSKAAGVTNMRIPSHDENADSALTVSKPENKSKKTKLPTGKSKSKEQGESQHPDEQRSVHCDAPIVDLPTETTSQYRGAPPGTSKDLTMAKNRNQDQIPCPVCLQSPFHLRYQCPIILAGPDAIKKRLDVLKRDNLSHQLPLVDELETMIKSRGDETSQGQNLNVNATFTVLSSVSVREELQSLSNASEPIPDTSPTALIPTVVVPVNPVPRPVISKTIVSGSSNEDTEDDTCEDPDDVGRNFVIKPPIKTMKQITVTPLVPDANIGLDTLIYGSATFRRSVADILSDAEKDEDEDREEIVLEEDDDSAFRRRAKKLSERLSDSSVEESDDPVDSPSSSAHFDDTEDEIRTSLPLRVGDQDLSSQEKNELGEPLEVDLESDALDKDSEVFTRPKDNSDNDAEVTPVSVEDRDLINEPLSLSLQSNIPSKSTRSSSLHSQPEVNVKKSPRVYVKPVPRSPLADKDVQHLSLLAESPRTKISPSLSSRKSMPRDSHQGELEEDPIEAVVDPLDLMADSTPSVTPPAAPIEGVVNTRIENRRGKTPAATEILSPPGDEVSASAVPPLVGEERLNETADSTRIVPTRKQEERQLAPKTRSTTRTAPRTGAATRTPLTRGRLLQLEREAAEKQVDREENAGPKAKQSLEKATGKKRNSRAETKQKSPLPASPEVSPDAVPPATSLPSSLTEWTTLQPSSPYVDQESQQTDQLRSSSPIQEGTSSDHTKKKKALITKTRRDSDDEAIGDNPINSTNVDPLFILSESQVPFPYSQKWTNNDPNGDHDQTPNLRLTTTSESENEVATSAKKRKPTRTPTYRSLIDIASQKLFSGPAVASATMMSQTPVNGKKKGSIFNILDGDDEEDEDVDDSGSDTELENSHIPKGRRAGVQVVLRSSRSR